MKRAIAFITSIVLIFGCSKTTDKGELVGVKGKKWNPEKPHGMTLVPGGSFIMGKADEDIANVNDATTKTVTVRSFYMDETEITNSEYREFVEWVKDSTIRFRLAIVADEAGIKPPTAGKLPSASKSKQRTDGKVNSGTIGNYAFADQDPTKMSPNDKYMFDNYFSIGSEDDPYSGRKINRKVKLVKNSKLYPDEYYAEAMDSLSIPIDDSYNGIRQIDVNKLKFKYSWMDIRSAAKSKNAKRKDFVKTEKVPIYPDTTTWIRDFTYSYNEPMHNDYFWHKAYGNYPVVGVNWNQAKAFCAWRTLKKNSYLKSKVQNGSQINNFRLPIESEWEYAARGGLQSATYPWGGPYTKDNRGCFLANFKPMRGDYAADGSLYTVEAKSYEANGYNLYNMSGNVAEWTESSYNVNSYEYVSSMNPNNTNTSDKRKVIRGGSWKDVAYFLQVGTRTFEYADSSRSFIGFRTVQDYMGKHLTQTKEIKSKK